MARLTADEVVGSDAERACLDALRRAVGGGDGPMERHSLRVFLIAERLAQDLDRRVDREVLLCASLLHDVGAYPLAATDDVYTADGRRFAADVLERFRWPEIRMRALGDAIERHHELTQQWEYGPETELLRRADLIDVSGGIVPFELSRPWLRGLFTAVPRDGLYGELAKIVMQMLRERPETVPQIFI
jgi:HD superfamily phosphohydrolase